MLARSTCPAGGAPVVSSYHWLATFGAISVVILTRPHTGSIVYDIGWAVLIALPVFVTVHLVVFAWPPLSIPPPVKKWSSYSRGERRTVAPLLAVLLAVVVYGFLRQHSHGL